MLDAKLLSTLAAIAREGSLERAARGLHLTPSAVSQRLRLLEERVGAVLIERGTPCRPTAVGARLCRHAETLALLEDGLRRELPGLRGERPARAQLRIAVNADSLATWFPAALAEFAASDLALLDLAVDDQDQTAAWLQRGQVAAAVCARASPVPGCRSRRLGALRYVATASPDFLARWFPAGLDAAGLARAPSLRYDRHDALQERWVRRLLRRELVLPAHSLPSSQAFVAACVAGVGWGMNPLSLVRQELAAGRLVELLPGQALDVALYWQCSRLELPALQALSAAVFGAAAAALD